MSYLKMKVKTTFVSAMNFKSKRLNEIAWVGADLVNHCDAQRLSRANVLTCSNGNEGKPYRRTRWMSISKVLTSFSVLAFKCEIIWSAITAVEKCSWRGEQHQACSAQNSFRHFGETFQGMKSKQRELNIFATLFSLELADEPDIIQHEIIELQIRDELKAQKLPSARAHEL